MEPAAFWPVHLADSLHLLVGEQQGTMHFFKGATV